MTSTTTRIAGIAAATLGLGLIALPFAAGATAAPGHTPVGICHATSSDTNPYVWIVVDQDSATYRGHLMHTTEPNKTWRSAGSWNGVEHAAGDEKPDFIEGLDLGISEAWCEADVVPVDEPTGTPTDTPTDEPTDTPTDEPVIDPTNVPTATPTDAVGTSTDAPGTIPSTGGQPQLAHTGSSTGVLLGLGGVLLATGAVFLVAGRKSENA